MKKKEKVKIKRSNRKINKEKKKTTVFTNHAYQSYNIQSLV